MRIFFGIDCIIIDSYSPFLGATQILLLSAVMYFFFFGFKLSKVHCKYVLDIIVVTSSKSSKELSKIYSDFRLL